MGFKNAMYVTGKLVLVLGLLYLFICSLDMLSISFRLVTGEGTTDLLGNSDFFSNPMVGLMIGILGTVAVQSSSTFTSIVISLVGANIIEPDEAVYIIMGSNIGTSVTNTIVSLTQIGDRNEFRRAFAAATVHDMFNWCTVIVMMTIEVATGFLLFISEGLAENLTGGGSGEVDIIKVITEPFVHLIIQINSTVLDEWAIGNCADCELQKRHCPEFDSPDKCAYLFNLVEWEDWIVGTILAVVSLAMLCTCLIFMVKLLQSLLQGAIAVTVKKVLNPDFGNKILNYLWGYVLIVIGAGLTFCVQSSSVFTSTLTPLVGIGLLEVETVYPLFLGSNIGTTSTGLLAALATEGDGLVDALTVSFVHLFFNCFGILIYYPIPFMRVPIPMCKILGNTTAKYRWFAIAYLVVMFGVLPAFVMVCSLNTILFICVMTPLGLLLLFVIVVNVMQRKRPKWLPKALRNWDFLPKWAHSLGYWDRHLGRCKCCDKYRVPYDNEVSEVVEMDGSKDGKERDVEGAMEARRGSGDSSLRKAPIDDSSSSSSGSDSGVRNGGYEHD